MNKEKPRRKKQDKYTLSASATHGGHKETTGQKYTVSQKGSHLTMAITLSILGRFAKFFHCCKQQ